MLIARCAAPALIALAAAFMGGPATARDALIEATELCLLKRSGLEAAAERIAALGLEPIDAAEVARDVGLARMAAPWRRWEPAPAAQLDAAAEAALHELRLRPGRHGPGSLAFSDAGGRNRLVLTGPLSDAPWSCLILVGDDGDLRRLLAAHDIELRPARAPGIAVHHAEVGAFEHEAEGTVRDVLAFSVDRRALLIRGIATDLAGGVAIRRR